MKKSRNGSGPVLNRCKITMPPIQIEKHKCIAILMAKTNPVK
jgi:hypothetical protein